MTVVLTAVCQADLALESDAVVLARAQDSSGSRRGAQIFTRTDCVVEETPSGSVRPGETVRTRVPGGRCGEDPTVDALGDCISAGCSH